MKAAPVGANQLAQRRVNAAEEAFRQAVAAFGRGFAGPNGVATGCLVDLNTVLLAVIRATQPSKNKCCAERIFSAE